MGPLSVKVDEFGIEDEFNDAFGARKVVSAETRDAILRAMGVPSDAEDPDLVPGTWVLTPKEVAERRVEHNGVVHTELGASVPLLAGQLLPNDLPFGYHRFVADDAQASPNVIQILVTPERCYLPDELRTWGWAVQLYAARSQASWGIGDLADLATLGRWTKDLGGGALMVNPLCAPAPIHPVEPSPYYPSSRRFRNPLFLCIEDVPGAAALAHVIAPLAVQGQALNAERHIDRDRVFDLKMQALELLWAAFPGDAAFDAYRRELGRSLDEFCAYAVLAERNGKDWRQWPMSYRQPSTEAVLALIAEEPRIAFHAWLQWLLDVQLAQASQSVRVIHDLPIGFDIAGADGWCWQDELAQDISVGCPPDGFNLDGQDWGLAPFIPSRLVASGFRPLIETVRAMLRHAGGLRIDHVMGLFRLFWIPRKLGTHGGSYVRYPSDAMLAIVAIESHRAQAVIVGEDLGTVLPGAREVLAAQRLLSYRLLFFEDDAPAQYPELALSSVTTHDLATISGIWTGDAIEHMRGAGVTPNVEGLRGLKDKLAKQGDIEPDATIREAIVGSYRALATAPSRILLATLDDALMVSEQPNLPGTIRQWPNWSLALPQAIEDFRDAPLPRELAKILSR